MVLADILEQPAKPNGKHLSPIHDLGQHLANFTDDRARGWHPSSLYGMCPRMEILMRLRDIVTESTALPIKTRVLFDVGNALHYWFQNKYFGPMGVLKGLWECNECRKIRFGFMNERCGVCGATKFTFKEVPVKDEMYGIVGQADGIYVPKWAESEDDEAVLDLKTAGAHWWKTKYIEPKYVYQVQIYRALLNRKKAIIFYIDKNGAESIPMYEHIMEADDRPIKDAQEKIDIFNLHRDKFELPLRLAECERPRSKRCKKCPLAHICMEDTVCHVLEQNWQESQQRIEV